MIRDKPSCPHQYSVHRSKQLSLSLFTLINLSVFHYHILASAKMPLCSTCGRCKFIDQAALFNHQKAKGHCYCETCKRTFVHEQAKQEHLITHLPKNRPCQQCGKSFFDEAALEQHRIALHERIYCQECHLYFDSDGELKQHSAAEHGSKCITCGLGFAGVSHLQAHQRSKNHCFCQKCNLAFTRKSKLDRHLKYAPAHASPEYHCCDCDRDFVHEQALRQHLQFKVHPPKADVQKPDMYPCPKCKRTFKEKADLSKHLDSLTHKPLSAMGCVGSSQCKKKFSAPSAMILHLESGKCFSGMTRDKLNFLVQSNDDERVISNGPENFLASAPHGSHSDSRLGVNLSMESNEAEQAISTRPESVANYYSDSDSDSDDGVPIYTPLSNEMRSPMIIPSADDLPSLLWKLNVTGDFSPSGIFTPRSSFGLTESTTLPIMTALACPLCPPDRKPFVNKMALQMHLASPKHAPKVFHCPTILRLTSKKGHQSRDFATLSGLTQHLESGACKGGKAGLKTAIKLLETRLAEMGFKHQGLLMV